MSQDGEERVRKKRKNTERRKFSGCFRLFTDLLPIVPYFPSFPYSLFLLTFDHKPKISTCLGRPRLLQSRLIQRVSPGPLQKYETQSRRNHSRALRVNPPPRQTINRDRWKADDTARRRTRETGGLDQSRHRRDR